MAAAPSLDSGSISATPGVSLSAGLRLPLRPLGSSTTDASTLGGLAISSALPPSAPGSSLGGSSFKKWPLVGGVLCSACCDFGSPSDLYPNAGGSLVLAYEFSKFALVCRFNGFWPTLADFHSWISSAWSPLLDDEVFACPCAKGFFVAVFDSSEDRDKVSSSGPWFSSRAGLSMQTWTPDFDPTTTSISSAPVWVRLPSLPLHFWGDKSLESIGNGLGKFLCKSLEAIPARSTFARICVEMDFNNGFPTEIILLGKGYSRTHKIDYENLYFRCRPCFETGHIARNCEKLPGKRRPPRSQRLTWWTEAPPEKQAERKIPASVLEGEADSAPKELVQGTDPVERTLPRSPKPTQRVSSWADIADAEEAQGQPENHDQDQSSEWQTVSKKKKLPNHGKM